MHTPTELLRLECEVCGHDDRVCFEHGGVNFKEKFSKSLSSQRQLDREALCEKIERLKTPEVQSKTMEQKVIILASYNQALDDVLQLIKEGGDHENS